MITEGVKIRAQIDAESVRHVMLVNGGGSVALLALLPAILGTPLVGAVLATLAIWLGGLTLAVIHSVLRRECSLVHEQHDMNPPAGSRMLWIQPSKPWVCWWSWKCLYLSILAFLVGGVVMVSVSFANLDALTAHNETAQTTSRIHNNSLNRTLVPRAG